MKCVCVCGCVLRKKKQLKYDKILFRPEATNKCPKHAHILFDMRGSYTLLVIKIVQFMRWRHSGRLGNARTEQKALEMEQEAKGGIREGDGATPTCSWTGFSWFHSRQFLGLLFNSI